MTVPYTILRFGGTTLLLKPWGCLAALPGGVGLPSAPHDTDAYRATAQALGYGNDTLWLCHEHDAVHAALADLMALPVSPVLSTAAGHESGTPEQRDLEEQAALAFQRWARAMNVDLRKVFATRGKAT
jgi:hypothetical protein